MGRFDLCIGVVLGVWLSSCALSAYVSYNAVRLSKVHWAAYTLYFGTMLTAIPIIPRVLCVTVEQNFHKIDLAVVAISIAMAFALAYTDMSHHNAIFILAVVNVVLVAVCLTIVVIRKTTETQKFPAYIDFSSDDE